MTDQQPKAASSKPKAAAKPRTKRAATPKQVQGPPEMGGVVFAPLYLKLETGEIIQISATARGSSLKAALDDWFEGINYAEKKYNATLSRPVPTARKRAGEPQPRSPQVPQESPNGKRPKRTDEDPVLEGYPAGTKVIPVKRIKTQTYPDKLRVSLYRNPTDESPVFTVEKTVGEIIEFLQKADSFWGVSHFSKPLSVTVNYKVYYIELINPDGEKNITLLDIRKS